MGGSSGSADDRTPGGTPTGPKLGMTVPSATGGTTPRAITASFTLARSASGPFVETLSRFRPDPEVVAGLAEIVDEHEEAPALPPGYVPRAWLDGRLMGDATFEGVYADVGHSRSLSYLRRVLAARVVHHGLRDLDGAAIRLTAPRRFTQEISRLVYECTEPDERQQFAGIRYTSRLGDEFENWGIFEPGRPSDEAMGPIRDDDPDLIDAFQRLGVTLGGE